MCTGRLSHRRGQYEGFRIKEPNRITLEGMKSVGAIVQTGYAEAGQGATFKIVI